MSNSSTIGKNFSARSFTSEGGPATSSFSPSKRSIGDLFTFEFKTLQVPERIKKIRVAVNVDSDLAIRGGQSSVNYNFDFFGVSQGGSISTPIADPSLNRAVSYIGTQGALLKTASELSPNETFSVKGEKAHWRF